MLARPLHRNFNYAPHNQGNSKENGAYNEASQYTLSDYGYGKDCVKVLHVKRNGPVHSIKEFEVGSHLKLYSKKDYFYGDNSDIVATDSQKNTVYLLAKKHGIENPESFALLLAKHFLNKYTHVEEAHVHVEEYPWQRICQEEVAMGHADSTPDNHHYSTFNDCPKHNHAFIFSPTALRYCDVVLRRKDPKQTIISGIKGLRVLKTTQSSFVNFVNDEYRSLPDQYDRIFSTVVDCAWEYSSVDVPFCSVWNKVKGIIIRNFAGDPISGKSSVSVQNTLYATEQEVLNEIKEISVISMTMPNKHYFNFDTKPFQSVVPGENNEVFIPTDKPHGTIYAQLARKDLKSHL